MRTIRRWAASCLFVLALAAAAFGVGADAAVSAARAYRSAGLPPATGMFLVADRDLGDPNFQRTVVLIIQHGDAGTTGLVVNRRTVLRLSELMPDMEHTGETGHRLFVGGPVGMNQIVMLLRKETAGERIEEVTEDVYFSADRRVLESMLARKKPERDLRLYVGHAGWAPGQLQYELARGDWHLTRAHADSIFGADIETLWDRLIRKLAPIGLEVRDDGLGQNV